jgi:alpha-ketoglutarate-dependent taurine dioxygenase
MSQITLTPSGKGLRITDRCVTDFSVAEIHALLERYHFLAFQERPISLDQASAYLGQFGTLTRNDRRQGAVLKIDGSKKEEGEVLLGDGFLPLHRDGALMGTNVVMVGIFCELYRDVSEGGRTFIVDLENASKMVPQAHMDLLRARGIEGRPVDRYYLKAADQWHPIPGFIEVDGKSYLNVGFPYRAGQKASWLMRIPGVDQARFDEVFDCLSDIMMSDTYCYYHEWQEGDLLLFDNRKTLHGREAFRGQRALANIQVLGS